MEIGIRVVRGPDWKWANQDGGEGHVGTIVEIGRPGSSTSPDKTVVVQWDSGVRTNYRVGYQGAFDLRVFDSAPSGVKHASIVCDSCSQNVFGSRWKCTRCEDFDLCSSCYMSDKHDLNHAFLRFDSQTTQGVKVPKRSNSVKLQSYGIFPGARVTRGPDWDWGNQDGGEGRLGTVLDVRGWDSESARSVANVAWDAGTTNVYRLGHKGKVDIKFKEAVPGPHYYRDHLNLLGESGEPAAVKATRCQFKVGDKVRVDLDVDILKVMQEGHGGWNPCMAEFVGKVGTVHRITERGDVRVSYEGCSKRWTFHSGALTKVQQFCVGDSVLILDDVTRVKELQKGHGEWTDNMRSALGEVGRILKVYADGDLRVSVGLQTWTFNPSCVRLLPRRRQDANNTLDPAHDREGLSNNLVALLEQLLHVDTQSPQAEPDTLVREAAQGHTQVVREVLAKFPDKVDQKSSGKTALQVASHQGHVDIVRLLVAAEANLEVADEDGDTALHYSAFGNQPEITDLLLQRGACVNALNKGGCSTLHVAVNKQHAKCVQVLLSHHCNVNIQDSYGDTALHDAIGKDNQSIVEMLCGAPGIDFTLKNKRGFNALHHAALKGNVHATSLILAKSPQLANIKKEDGFSALHLAALNGHYQTAHNLITQGHVDVNATNSRQQSALHLATSQGHSALVEMLVQAGAEVNLEDEDSDTSLHICLQRQTAFSPKLSQSPLLAELGEELGVCQEEVRDGTLVACFLLRHGANLQHKNARNTSPADLVKDQRLADLVRRAMPPQKSEPPEGATECVVCSDTFACVTFDPCGHTIVCIDCCIKMKKCIQCQVVIKQKLGAGGVPISSLPQFQASQQVRDLQRRVQEMEDSVTCSICLERQRDTVFLCGHSACAICAKPLKQCHMCRKPITARINLFN